MLFFFHKHQALCFSDGAWRHGCTPDYGYSPHLHSRYSTHDDVFWVDIHWDGSYTSLYHLVSRPLIHFVFSDILRGCSIPHVNLVIVIPHDQGATYFLNFTYCDLWLLLFLILSWFGPTSNLLPQRSFLQTQACRSKAILWLSCLHEPQSRQSHQSSSWIHCCAPQLILCGINGRTWKLTLSYYMFQDAYSNLPDSCS